MLAIPFVLPILVPVCFPLYPLAAAGFGIAYLVAVQFFPSTDIPTGGYNWYALAPTLVVFWLLMRLDNRLGERRPYWFLRHAYLLLFSACLLIYLFTFDAPRPNDIFSRLGDFFTSVTAMGVSFAVLGLIHYTLYGEGGIKAFWHGIMRFLRMRPSDL